MTTPRRATRYVLTHYFRINLKLLYTLVTVDATAAPLCMLSVNSILAPCVALWNILIHNECSHIFHTIGEITTGNKRKVPCTVLIKTFSVLLYLFHFLHLVHFICRKVSLEIKRTFDRFTLAHSSLDQGISQHEIWCSANFCNRPSFC